MNPPSSTPASSLSQPSKRKKPPKPTPVTIPQASPIEQAPETTLKDIANAATATQNFHAMPMQAVFDPKAMRVAVSEHDVCMNALDLLSGADGTHFRHNGRGGLAVNNYDLDMSTEAQLVSLMRVGVQFASASTWADESWAAGGAVGRTLQASVRDALDETLADLLIRLRSDENLSLYVIVARTAAPARRVKLLHGVISNCHDRPASRILSNLATMCQQPSNAKVIRPIFEAAMTVYQDSLVYWLSHGCIDDPLGEFLIRAAEAGPKDWWADRYRVAKGNFPIFLEMTDAALILLVGKTVNFYKMICRETPPPLPAALNDYQIWYGAEHRIRRRASLKAAAASVNALVLRFLRQDCAFLEHVKAMRDYVLLQRGDFADHLRRKLQKSLDVNAAKVQSCDLPYLFEETLGTFPFPEDTPYQAISLDMLSAGGSESASEELGWELMYVKYRVPDTLQSVVEASSTSAFVRLSQWQWRLRHLEARLNAGGQLLRGLERRRSEFPELVSPMKALNMGRQAATLFLTDVANFCAHEGLVVGWERARPLLASATDVDELRAAQAAFVEAGLRSGFLKTGQEDLNACLGAVLREAEVLAGLAAELGATFSDWRLREAGEAAASSGRLSQWGAELEAAHVAAERRAAFAREVKDVQLKAALSRTAFRSKAALFLVALAGESEEVFQGLAIRLNHGGYYDSAELRMLMTTKGVNNSRFVSTNTSLLF